LAPGMFQRRGRRHHVPGRAVHDERLPRLAARRHVDALAQREGRIAGPASVGEEDAANGESVPYAAILRTVLRPATRRVKRLRRMGTLRRMECLLTFLAVEHPLFSILRILRSVCRG